MVLKKQTVFLLTLLTLMVVLFTYQLTNDPDQTTTTQNEDGKGQVAATNTKDGATVTSIENVNDFFTAEKLERDNKRQALIEQLYSVTGDATKPAEEIAKATDDINTITAMAASENDLEEALSAMFPDAVVLSDDGHIMVYVQSDDLTAAQADEVIQLVREEMNVASAAITVEAKPVN